MRARKSREATASVDNMNDAQRRWILGYMAAVDPALFEQACETFREKA